MKTHHTLLAGLALTALTLSAAPVRAQAAQAPTELVYLNQIPTAAELVKTAGAEGLTVTKIDQTNGETIVTYKYPDGRLNTVSYQVLPAGEPGATTVASGPSAVPVPTPAPSTALVYQAAPAPTVVYQTTAPDYYYAPYAYGPGYYPWGWYAPVGVSVGFGFGHGGYRGGYYHGGHHWR